MSWAVAGLSALITGIVVFLFGRSRGEAIGRAAAREETAKAGAEASARIDKAKAEAVREAEAVIKAVRIERAESMTSKVDEARHEAALEAVAALEARARGER